MKRNGSAIIAFAIGGSLKPNSGFSIIGAHTDSPCLKIKPRSKREKVGYAQVGVELYGGGLWHTWFDRDLSIAGRVMVKATADDEALSHRLTRIDAPVLRIPTLAIHLDRSTEFKFNNEVQLTPILGLAESQLNASDDKGTLHPLPLLQAIADDLHVAVDRIGDFELCLYDTQGAQIGGIKDEFLFSARLDNLMMSFCSLTALIESDASLAVDENIRVVSLFDNEEVGSNTAHGADSNFLEVTLRRISALNITSTNDVEVKKMHHV